MHPYTQQLTEEMDILYGLYHMALEYTSNWKPEGKWDSYLDRRQKILGKTQASSRRAAALMKKTEKISLPSNERALLLEKRGMIEEVLKKMQQAENQIFRHMYGKMNGLRAELADIQQRQHAASAYSFASRQNAVA